MIIHMDRNALVDIAMNRQDVDLKSKDRAGYFLCFNIYLDLGSGEYYVVDDHGSELIRTEALTNEGLEELFDFIRDIVSNPTVH